MSSDLPPDLAPDGHGGQLEAWARRLGCATSELIDFSISLNPLGPPPAAVEAARQSLLDPARYPEPDAAQLRHALAAYHAVDPRSVWVGAGSTDLIYRLAQDATAAHGRGWRGLVLGPTFSEYARACRAAGGIPVDLGQDSCPAPLAEGDAALGFACRPNSPLGPGIDDQTLSRWRTLTGGSWVVDEAFACLTDSPRSLILEAQRPGSQLTVLRSLTKAFACPWLRVGYLIAEPATTARLARISPPWSVSGPAQAFTLAALAHAPEYLRASRELIGQLRSRMLDALAQIPDVQPLPAFANYLCFRVPDASAWQTALAHRRLIVRDCRSFVGLEQTPLLRIGLRPWPELERLLHALQALSR